MSKPFLMSHDSPRRVLIFCLSGLGDAILASPAIAALAGEPKQFRLTLVTMFPVVAEYLRCQNFTDDVRQIRFLGMSKRQIFRHALALRRERFDVSVLPYAMNRLGYNILGLVVGARLRIGFRYARQRNVNCPWLNHRVIDEDASLHAVRENLRWASVINGQAVSTLNDELCYAVTSDGERRADEFMRANGLDDASPLIGIHGGCNNLKNQQMRCWPADRLGALIQQIGRKWPRARVVLFEGPTDIHLNAAVMKSAGPQGDTIAVARMLPMPAVAALIRRCRLFLSNDSGLMHTAAACKVPCVAIFGPTNPAWVHPWKTEHVIVSRHLPCSPCFYYSSRPLRCVAGIDYACVREIAVDDVWRAVAEMLESKRTVEP
jgi:heptosyltransferase-2